MEIPGPGRPMEEDGAVTAFGSPAEPTATNATERGSGRRRVIILGCTGSVGTQALEVIAGHPDAFEVVGLAAGGAQEELFAAQAAAYPNATLALAAGGEAIAPGSLVHEPRPNWWPTPTPTSC